MKKSEMLDIITEKVLQSEHLYHLGKIKARNFANELLVTIEESGMLPPPQWKEVRRDWGTYMVDGEREWDK